MSSSKPGFSMPPAASFMTEQQHPHQNPHQLPQHHSQQQQQQQQRQQFFEHRSLQAHNGAMDNQHPEYNYTYSSQHAHLQQQQQQQQQHQHHHQQQQQQQLQLQLQHSRQNSHHSASPQQHNSAVGYSPAVITPPLYTTTPGFLSPPPHPRTPSDRIPSPGPPGARTRKHESLPSVNLGGGPPGASSARKAHDSNDSYFTHHPHAYPPPALARPHQPLPSSPQEQQAHAAQRTPYSAVVGGASARAGAERPYGDSETGQNPSGQPMQPPLSRLSSIHAPADHASRSSPYGSPPFRPPTPSHAVSMQHPSRVDLQPSHHHHHHQQQLPGQTPEPKYAPQPPHTRSPHPSLQQHPEHHRQQKSHYNQQDHRYRPQEQHPPHVQPKAALSNSSGAPAYEHGPDGRYPPIGRSAQFSTNEPPTQSSAHRPLARNSGDGSFGPAGQEMSQEHRDQAIREQYLAQRLDSSREKSGTFAEEGRSGAVQDDRMQGFEDDYRRQRGVPGLPQPSHVITSARAAEESSQQAAYYRTTQTQPGLDPRASGDAFGPGSESQPQLLHRHSHGHERFLPMAPNTHQPPMGQTIVRQREDQSPYTPRESEGFPQHADVHTSGSRFGQTRIDTAAQPPDHLPLKVAREQAGPPAMMYDDPVHQRPGTPVYPQHRQHHEQQHHEQQHHEQQHHEQQHHGQHQQIRMQMMQDEQTRTFRSQHSPPPPQSRVATVLPLNEIHVGDAGHQDNIRFAPGPHCSADHGLPQDTDGYRHPDERFHRQSIPIFEQHEKSDPRNMVARASSLTESNQSRLRQSDHSGPNSAPAVVEHDARSLYGTRQELESVDSIRAGEYQGNFGRNAGQPGQRPQAPPFNVTPKSSRHLSYSQQEPHQQRVPPSSPPFISPSDRRPFDPQSNDRTTNMGQAVHFNDHRDRHSQAYEERQHPNNNIALQQPHNAPGVRSEDTHLQQPHPQEQSSFSCPPPPPSGWQNERLQRDQWDHFLDAEPTYQMQEQTARRMSDLRHHGPSDSTGAERSSLTRTAPSALHSPSSHHGHDANYSAEYPMQMVGLARESPPDSTRSRSPESGKKRGKKFKARVGTDVQRDSTMPHQASEHSPRSAPVSSSGNQNELTIVMEKQSPTSKRQGRRNKPAGDPETEMKIAMLKPWSVITPASHRKSVGTGDAPAHPSRPLDPTTAQGKTEKAPEHPHVDHDASFHQGLASRGDIGGRGYDLKESAMVDDRGLAMKQGSGPLATMEYDRQQPEHQLQPQQHHPYPPPSATHRLHDVGHAPSSRSAYGSVEEFEFQQRQHQEQLQHQEHLERQQQQHLRLQNEQIKVHQAPFSRHPQDEERQQQEHSSHLSQPPPGAPKYGIPPAEAIVSSTGATQIEAGHLEADVADALITFQHQHQQSPHQRQTSHGQMHSQHPQLQTQHPPGFHSQETTSNHIHDSIAAIRVRDANENRRVSLETSIRPMDPTNHQNPVHLQEENEPSSSHRGHLPQQPGPLAAARPDWAPEEQETARILQDMMNDRAQQETYMMEQEGPHPSYHTRNYSGLDTGMVAARSPPPHRLANNLGQNGPSRVMSEHPQQYMTGEGMDIDPVRPDNVNAMEQQEQQRQQMHNQGHYRPIPTGLKTAHGIVLPDADPRQTAMEAEAHRLYPHRPEPAVGHPGMSQQSQRHPNTQPMTAHEHIAQGYVEELQERERRDRPSYDNGQGSSFNREDQLMDDRMGAGQSHGRHQPHLQQSGIHRQDSQPHQGHHQHIQQPSEPHPQHHQYAPSPQHYNPQLQHQEGQHPFQHPQIQDQQQVSLEEEARQRWLEETHHAPDPHSQHSYISRQQYHHPGQPKRADMDQSGVQTLRVTVPESQQSAILSTTTVGNPSSQTSTPATPTGKGKGKGRGKVLKAAKGQTGEAGLNQDSQVYNQDATRPGVMQTATAADDRSTIAKAGRKKNVRTKTLSQEQLSADTFESTAMETSAQLNGGESGRSRTVTREEISQNNVLLSHSSDPIGQESVKVSRPKSMLFGSGVILVDKLPGDSDPDDDMGEKSLVNFPPAKYLSEKTRAALGYTPKVSADENTQAGGDKTTVSSTVFSLKKLRAGGAHDIHTLSAEPQKQEGEGQQEHSVHEDAPYSNNRINIRSRKIVVTGSTDADIERSNQITRLTEGPAWMQLGSPTSSVTPNTSLTSDGDVSKRRVKVKPKRLRIDDIDLRQQLQRSLSSVTDPESAVMAVQPLPRGEEQQPGVTQPEAARRVDLDVTEDEGSGVDRDDVKSVHSFRESGSYRRDNDHNNHEKESDDDKSNGGGGGATANVTRRGAHRTSMDNGSNSKGIQGGTNDSNGGQRGKQGSGDNGGGKRSLSASVSSGLVSFPSGEDDASDRNEVGSEAAIKSEDPQLETASVINVLKIMKRKSNSNLIGSNLFKKSKDMSKDSTSASFLASSVDLPTSPSILKTQENDMDVETPIGDASIPSTKLKKQKEEEEDEMMDYLPMEDDISCPHLFGIEDSENDEDEADDDRDEEDVDENDDMDEGLTEESSPSATVKDLPTRQGPLASKSEDEGKVGSRKKSIGSGGTKGQQPVSPLDPIQIKGRDWVKRLAMPEIAWEETFKTYESVKRLKELKNRQPVRKREAILAAILYIVCRNQNSPRTFSEICTASGVKRGDVGTYYRLMLKILEPSQNATASARNTDAEAFMTRWCESLSLPPQVRHAAVHVFSLANSLNLTSGKCPSSVGAAAIYLCIFSWNDARRLARCQRYSCAGCQGQGTIGSNQQQQGSLAQANGVSSVAANNSNSNSNHSPVIFGAGAGGGHPGADQDQGWIKKEHKDVAAAVGVVSATLLGCFRNLAPERERLIPEEFLSAAIEGV